MSGLLGIKVEGAAELIEEFKKYSAKVQNSEELHKAVIKSGIDAGTEAKKILQSKVYKGDSPENWKRTGLLRARTSGDIKSRTENNNIVTSVRSRTKYAKYIEFGTGIFATSGTGRKTPWVYKTNQGVFLTTRGAKARPFLAPAVANTRDKTIATLKKGVLKFLQKNASKNKH